MAQMAAGEDVVVLELVTPAYDETAGSVTCGANVLAEYEGEGLAHVAAQQQDDALPEQFTRASLFIDNCSDQTMTCCSVACGTTGNGTPHCVCDQHVGDLGTFGFCWYFGDICCHPCTNADHSYWDSQSTSAFSAQCQGNCGAFAFDNLCW